MRKSWKGKRAGSGSKVRLPTGNGCLSPTAASNCAANNLDELGSRFILWNKIHILWQENLKLKNSLLFFGLPWPLCALCICIMNLAVQCPTLCDPKDCSMPGFPVHPRLLELAQAHSIESVMPSNSLILGHPLLLLPSICLSISVFSYCREGANSDSMLELFLWLAFLLLLLL